MSGFDGFEQELDRLGPHRTGKSCLYLKKLDAIDMAVLERIMAHSLAVMAERYPVQGNACEPGSCPTAAPRSHR
jgi:hypothetical protein